MDACLIELFASGELLTGRVALVALGGYGRGELAPASDVDLMVLHASRDPVAVRTLAESLFYPLWDSGFAVGNAVRTPKECASLAAERLDVATALLDARLLDGDESLFREMRERVSNVVRRDARGFTGKLWAAAAERREKFGSVSHLLEPDVKEGAGGLRDIQSLGWAAAAVTGPDGGGLRALESAGLLRAPERARLEAAEEYLVRLRSALHLETGRKADRVPVDAQPSLARALGFEDEPGLPAVDGLMRATFEHARAVEHVTEAAFGRMLAGGAPEADDAEVDPTPEGVIGVFAAAAADDGVVPPALLDRAEAVELPDEVAWTPAVRDAFLSILRAGSKGVAALEAMDRAGLLAPFLPEWSPVRCRPQRDPYHRYTVDVHLLEAVARMGRVLREPPGEDSIAARAVAAVDDVDGLLLGAFLHDIGKTGRGGHVAAGARAASAALARMGLPEPTRELAQFLVENHLLLSDTATRRDLEDENLVLDVAARVGDAERLAALYLLTVADAGATGPHAWTPWRATLTRELVAKVQHVLERGDVGPQEAERSRRSEAIRESLANEDRIAVERFLSRMPHGYLAAVPPERVARHFHLVASELGQVEVRTLAESGARPGTHALTVVARDRPGLLARIAGALALSGLSILTAQVFTTEDGVAVDLFEVEAAFDEEVDEERWRKFRSTLRRAVEGRLSLEYRVREKRQYYPKPRADVPVKVKVDNEASDFFTVIEVGAADRIGLLFDITRTLFELELDVHIAKVATLGERVVDAFYVRDVLGQKVEDQDHADEIAKAITARLSE